VAIGLTGLVLTGLGVVFALLPHRYFLAAAGLVAGLFLEGVAVGVAVVCWFARVRPSAGRRPWQ
jgi:hypothetical protein